MELFDPIASACASPLPERLLARLGGLPKLFTRPTWQNVLLLVAGAILAPGKRTVTAALRILGREQENNFPIYHGVLNRAVWSSRAVAGWLLRLLVTTFVAADATVVIGIDDTIERRWGHINLRIIIAIMLSHSSWFVHERSSVSSPVAFATAACARGLSAEVASAR